MKKTRWIITRKTAAKMLVVLSGVLVFVALSRLDACLTALRWVAGVFRPILMGLAIAFAADPLIRWLERRGMKRRPAVAVGGSFLLLLFGGGLALSLPQFFRSLRSLISSVPFYFSQLRYVLEWSEGHYGLNFSRVLEFMDSYLDLMARALEWALSNLPLVLSYGYSVIGFIIQLFTASILAVYLLLAKHTLLRQGKKILWATLPAAGAKKALHICATANRMLRGFIVGKVLDSLIIWALCTAISTLAGVPYASLFSFVVGVTNIVPVAGPIAGGVFCCLLLLVLNPVKAVFFALLLVLLQQADAHIIGPWVLKDITGMQTLWVLVAIFIGGQIGGISGMILGVPLFATLYALAREFLNSRLEAKGIDQYGSPVEDDFDWDGEEAEDEDAFAPAPPAEGNYMEVRLRLEEDTLTDIWGEITSALSPELLASLEDWAAEDEFEGEDGEEEPHSAP
ncbi:MAG: AI-2E family transporter [Oscillospiraceae bacterium]|nr:AI-2E family transporter [Oscillospiraceae bacterium]